MCDSSIESIKTHYQENFDPAAYRDIVSGDVPDENFNDHIAFLLQAAIDILKDEKLCGTSLIDIGSGPTLYHLAPLCHQFSHIVVSDFNLKNVEQLKKWVRGDEDSLDWTKLFETTAKIQGCEDPKAGSLKIQETLRKHVKAAIPCDVLADQVVAEEYRGPYDFVMTSLTLESASPDYETYKNCYKKINRLMKLGGLLLVKGFLMGGTWKCGDHIFPHLKVSRSQVQTALEEAGFGEIHWKVQDHLDDDLYIEYESLYVVRAKKITECLV